MKALLTRNIKAVLVQTQSAKVKVRKKRRKGTVRYSEYDADGATPLDFEEWFSMMPLRVRRTFPASVIRTWFEEADRCEDEGPPPSMPPSHEPPGTSGDQRVSINSFFYFTLSQRGIAMGAASLEAAFSEYDQQPAYLGRGGLLDRDEFAVVCKAMGFSARAEFIFRSLDKDRSGEIGYEELTDL